jgi:tol-pal system protein YbgF
MANPQVPPALANWRGWLRPFTSVVLLCSATACVTAGEGELMHRDIDALKEAQKADRDAATAERQRLKDDSASKAKELQDALDALNRAARKSGADLSVDLDKAKDDIASLRGAIEVLQHRLDALEAAQGEQAKKLDPLVSDLARKQKQQDVAEHPTDKAAIYALALKKLDAGETVRARELLTDFLARFKGDPLAPNAQYWLGETWYAEKHFNDAIVEFQKVLKEYKASEKVPDALLKIGLAFQSQGDCDKALLFLDEVVQTYKASPAAKVAKDRAADCKKKK